MLRQTCHVSRRFGYTGYYSNESSLDCPVLRLTLLFFGAAKDVPEAAKMVTAGTACLHSRANYRPNLTGPEYYDAGEQRGRCRYGTIVTDCQMGRWRLQN
jgi:hypothetical protein